MVHDRTAAQTERYALIHDHFVYEYIFRPRKRHADVIEDFLGLPLFLRVFRCFTITSANCGPARLRYFTLARRKNAGGKPPMPFFNCFYFIN